MQSKVEKFLKRNPVSNYFIKRYKGCPTPEFFFKPTADKLIFVKSMFEGRPPTAFFPYPDYISVKRMPDRISVYRREDADFLCMSVKSAEEINVLQFNMCNDAGFKIIDCTDPNTFWNLKLSGDIKST